MTDKKLDEELVEETVDTVETEAATPAEVAQVETAEEKPSK